MSAKNSINVDQSGFAKDVIQQSHQRPVLVDFWAPWCGPCRMLTPVLEKLAGEFNGRFLLAKVNTDQNQMVSGQYGVQGIPNVKLFKNGKVIDEFVGAQPEPMVRQFLQRHVPPQQASRPTAAKPQTPPLDAEGRLRQAKTLLRQARGCEAQALLHDFPTGSLAVTAAKLRPLADFLCTMEQGRSPSEKPNVTDLYRQAAQAVRHEPSAALYLLVALHQEDSAGKKRVTTIMEGVFTLLGDGDPLVQQYRQQLATVTG